MFRLPMQTQPRLRCSSAQRPRPPVALVLIRSGRLSMLQSTGAVSSGIFSYSQCPFSRWLLTIQSTVLELADSVHSLPRQQELAFSGNQAAYYEQ